MPARQVDINYLFDKDVDTQIIDVRSPGEFQKAHIPGALNLPLFTDEERAIVGTAYKQESPEKAMLLGLEIAGSKMRWYVETALLLAPHKKVLLHCWRGGKRSESMGWLLSMSGFNVQVLKGGYKAYRNSVHGLLNNNNSHFILIGGPTGTGKTEILYQLALAGEQIIDLEKLSCHKGSAFGSLGQQEQPSTEHFENLLFEEYRKLQTTKRIFIENESHMIGRCMIPLEFFKQMRQYFYIQCQIPYQQRIDRLVTEYAHFPKQELCERFIKIRTKLGGDQLKLALQYLEEDRFDAAAGIALKFYDKVYQYGYENNETPQKTILTFENADAAVMAGEIIQLCNKLNV